LLYNPVKKTDSKDQLFIFLSFSTCAPDSHLQSDDTTCCINTI